MKPNWKPIKTAPKDGRWIMAWCGNMPKFCYFDAEMRMFRSQNTPIRIDVENQPTHWMPLPSEPPKTP